MMNEVLTKLAMVLLLVAVDYVCVLVAVLADMRSGLMKAKRCGQRRCSRGYRRTVDKAGRYYVTLVAMTVIDSMIVSATMFLWLTSGPEFPPLPLFTTLGAICLCMIEVKSIYENSQVDGDYDGAGRMLKAGLEEIMKIIDEVKNIIKY